VKEVQEEKRVGIYSWAGKGLKIFFEVHEAMQKITRDFSVCE